MESFQSPLAIQIAGTLNLEHKAGWKQHISNMPGQLAHCSCAEPLQEAAHHTQPRAVCFNSRVAVWSGLAAAPTPRAQNRIWDAAWSQGGCEPFLGY